MRFAKAEYIRALKDLRAADAEYVRAQAAFELARARYKDAQTANLNADTEYQKLLNEYQQLINEARQDTNDFISQEIANRIDSVKKRMELREKEHAAKMVAAEDSLAMAQERLRLTLRNIALYSQSLTPDEQYALMDAVDMYEAAVEATADQTIVVLQAQRTLDSLQMVREVGPDTAYDKSSKAYIGQVDKWKKDIETKQVEQALVAAILLAVPDSLVYDDVDGWKAQIDALVKDSTELEYNKYQVTTDIAQYYVNYVHDGVTKFNEAAQAWIDKNGANATEKLTPAEKTDYNNGTAPSKATYTSTNAPVIAIPAFDDLKAASSAAYAKFVYLLNSYEKKSPADSWSTDKNIIHVSNDTMYVTANQSMKAFVMGAADATKDSLTYQTKTKDGKKDSVLLKAMYGIDGAVSVLERDKVLDKTAGSKDTAELRQIRDDAKEAWETDREILIKGLASYQPYIDALAAYEAAASDAASAEGNMKKALDTLTSAFKSVNGTAKLSTNDSVRILAAFKDFAAARETYLEYTFSGEGHDSTYFVYSKGKGVGDKPIMDSVKFVDLSFTDLAKGVYNWDAVSTGSEGDKNYPYGTPDTYVTTGAVAFANIANQLLGAKAAALMSTITSAGWDVMGNDSEQTINDGTNYTAFFKTYKWDYTDKRIEDLAGNPVESSALETAKENVIKAVKAYVGVYNRFWGVTAIADYTTVEAAYDLYFAAADKDKADYLKGNKKKSIKGAEPTVNEYLPYKAGAYSFDTFNTPTNVVSYVTNNTNKMVDWSNAMGAILGSVEYAITGGTACTDGHEFQDGTNGYVTETKTFGTSSARTEFYSYMKAEWDYQVSLQDFDSDLAKIKAWVMEVRMAFEADEAQAGIFDEEKYNAAVTKFNAAKAKVDAWKAAAKAYTGAEVTPRKIVGTYPDPASITWKTDGTGRFELAEYSDFTPNTATGEWVSKIGGKTFGGTQLELAKEIFPEFPAKLKEWSEAIAQTEDLLQHYHILLQSAKDAYFAAAKANNELVQNKDKVDPANFDQLVKNYQDANKRYRERLVGIIEKLQGQIETLEERIAKFNQGIPQLDILIAEAEKDLKVESARLKGYEEALAYAKANLDHLLEYIKSLDANFVVPAFDPTKII